LIVIAYLEKSKDKGKGKAPSKPVDGLEDGSFLNSEACLGSDEPVTDQDDSDSNFEACEHDDSEYEEGGDITLRNGRKLPCRRASRLAVRDYDRPEEEEAIMFDPTITAFIRDASYGDASTSTGFVGFHIPTHSAALAAATAEHRLAREHSLGADSEIASDSDVEEELLLCLDSEDELIAQRVQSNLGKRRNTNKGKGKTEYDDENPHFDYVSAPREAGRHPGLEKQEIKMREYQLGRRLTYVGLTSISMV
jgi:hypothetical protein